VYTDIYLFCFFLGYVISETNIESLSVLRHYFKLGGKGTEAGRKIQKKLKMMV